MDITFTPYIKKSTNVPSLRDGLDDWVTKKLSPILSQLLQTIEEQKQLIEEQRERIDELENRFYDHDNELIELQENNCKNESQNVEPVVEVNVFDRDDYERLKNSLKFRSDRLSKAIKEHKDEYEPIRKELNRVDQCIKEGVKKPETLERNEKRHYKICKEREGFLIKYNVITPNGEIIREVKKSKNLTDSPSESLNKSKPKIETSQSKIDKSLLNDVTQTKITKNQIPPSTDDDGTEDEQSFEYTKKSTKITGKYIGQLQKK